MQQGKLTDFTIKVPGIGTFVFAKRNLRLEIAANVAYSRLTENVDVDDITGTYCRAIADLNTLMVDGPEGWSEEEIDEMDSFDPETYNKLVKVWRALLEKEETFRPAKPAGSQESGGADGEGTLDPNGGDVRAVVSPDVQPPPD